MKLDRLFSTNVFTTTISRFLEQQKENIFHNWILATIKDIIFVYFETIR